MDEDPRKLDAGCATDIGSVEGSRGALLRARSRVGAGRREGTDGIVVEGDLTDLLTGFGKQKKAPKKRGPYDNAGEK